MKYNVIIMIDLLIANNSPHMICGCKCKLERHDNNERTVFCGNYRCNFRCEPYEFIYQKSEEDKVAIVEELKKIEKRASRGGRGRGDRRGV
jgi:hypothetical protein